MSENGSDSAAWNIAGDLQRPFPTSPSFANVRLEGVADGMLPFLYWPAIRTFYWKRLCPENLNLPRQRYPVIKCGGVRALKIFSVLHDDPQTDHLPVFSWENWEYCHLSELFLVALEGSKGIWNLPALITDVGSRRGAALRELCMVNMDPDTTPFMDFDELLHNVVHTVSSLSLCGYRPDFLSEGFKPRIPYKTRHIMCGQAPLGFLKKLSIDLGSLDVKEYDENFCQPSKKAASSYCHLTVPLPYLRQLQIMVSPYKPLPASGTGIDFAVRLSLTSVNRLLIDELVPLSGLWINGSAAEFKQPRPKRVGHFTVFRSSKSCPGAFVKETTPKVYEMSFEDWVDHFNASGSS